MGPFVCRSCLTPSDQAARCPACGARSFRLSEEARMVADAVAGRSERRGQLVPITDAPSLRRRRRTAAG